MCYNGSFCLFGAALALYHMVHMEHVALSCINEEAHREEAKAMFHAIMVAGRKKFILFQFLLFRSSEWQTISAESTFHGIHFGPTSKVNSAES